MSTDLSVIIPTYNEEQSITHIIQELQNHISSLQYEIIIVDDSDDNTPTVVRRIATTVPSIQLIHRPPEQRTGLATAVVDGMASANGEFVAVMDGDGQHPADTVANMFAEARTTGCDMVIPSRYLTAGDWSGLDQSHRKLCSRLTMWIPRILFPARLIRISDPLSGLFLVRKQRLNIANLAPVGWKISLEIILMSDVRTVHQLPYRFQRRVDGFSKANVTTAINFLRHLHSLFLRYYFHLYRLPVPRSSKWRI